jgi:hypothetical protein
MINRDLPPAAPPRLHEARALAEAGYTPLTEYVRIVELSRAGLRAAASGSRRRITDEERQAELAHLAIEIDVLRGRAAGVGADMLAYLLASAAAEASDPLTNRS